VIFIDGVGTVPQTLAHSDGELVRSQVWQAFKVMVVEVGTGVGAGVGTVPQTLAHSEGELFCSQT
jgi:hypothetical protein